MGGDTPDIEQYDQLLRGAVFELRRAADRMLAAHSSMRGLSQLPRPRRFVIAGNVSWPDNISRPDDYRDFILGASEAGGECRPLSWLPDIQAEIKRACRGQPRRILHAIRQLQAAARWCDARVAGMERERVEIIRKQSRAVETLQAMASMSAIAKLGEGNRDA